MYSEGVTSYNLLVGAIVITVVLLVLQWLTSLASRMPSRWHALTYVPSALLLTMLTNMDRDTIAHFSLGAWVWVAPTVLVTYVLLVLIIRHVDRDASVYSMDVKSQIYTNFIVLFVLILTIGAVPKSTDVYHYELKTERLLLEGDYEAAAKVGEKSLRTSLRLTQLRMYALSKQGLLAERLFEYPQLDGSKGLLDLGDTLVPHRFDLQKICAHLGAYCTPSVKNAYRYYQLLLADSVAHPRAADYYLCSLLLDKKLDTFLQRLPHYYSVTDSLGESQLPKAYREALLLGKHVKYRVEGQAETENHFKAYQAAKAQYPNLTERINRLHREYGDTYWWYYDFSDIAKGELERR